MKKIFIILLFISINLYSQTDKNGNPVFNSITTSEEKINDFQLNSNYYTLDNNINNKKSSVYINENLSLDEIEASATKLPSDFFLVLKNNSPINMIMIVNKPERVFFVINPSSGSQKFYDCDLKGEIFENRANEIIKNDYDKKAKIVDGKLFFNEKYFSIIKNSELKNKILQLIKENKLSAGAASNTKILDKGMLRSLIIKESQENGKLDFFSEIKGHEMDGVQVKPGVFTNKQGISLYKWGRANYEMGVNTVEDALSIWSEIKTRKPNQREIDYITMGFNKELEK